MEKKDIWSVHAGSRRKKRKKGEGEQEPESITKSKKQIIRENVLTLFNLLNFIIAGLLFAVGSVYQHDLHRDHYTEYRDWDRTGMQSQETGR